MPATRSWSIAHCIGRWSLTLLGLVLLAMLAINAWIIGATQARVYDHIKRVSDHKVALVLGTSPYTESGAPNLLFKYRMLAAAQLYTAGKVQLILASGANPGYYNEPQEMYQALRRLGVPDEAIELDFAGYSTFDSIVRSKRIFGADHYIIVSQRYHVYRALFIAQHKGIDAIAYVWPAEDARQAFFTVLREYFARVKAVLDLFVWDAEPRYLGPRVPLAVPGEDHVMACRPADAENRRLLFGWRRDGVVNGHEQPAE